jgi:hypothetical protein
MEITLKRLLKIEESIKRQLITKLWRTGKRTLEKYRAIYEKTERLKILDNEYFLSDSFGVNFSGGGCCIRRYVYKLDEIDESGNIYSSIEVSEGVFPDYEEFENLSENHKIISMISASLVNEEVKEFERALYQIPLTKEEERKKLLEEKRIREEYRKLKKERRMRRKERKKEEKLRKQEKLKKEIEAVKERNRKYRLQQKLKRERLAQKKKEMKKLNA